MGGPVWMRLPAADLFLFTFVCDPAVSVSGSASLRLYQPFLGPIALDGENRATGSPFVFACGRAAVRVFVEVDA